MSPLEDKVSSMCRDLSESSTGSVYLYSWTCSNFLAVDLTALLEENPDYDTAEFRANQRALELFCEELPNAFTQDSCTDATLAALLPLPRLTDYIFLNVTKGSWAFWIWLALQCSFSLPPLLQF